MSPHGKSPGKGWWAAAAIGAVLFLLIQVFPSFGHLFDTERHSVLSREEARRRAEALAADRFGLDPAGIVSAQVTYMTDSRAAAYFSKHDLPGETEPARSVYRTYPTDVYRIDLELDDGTVLRLSLHMETGTLVAWTHAPAAGPKQPLPGPEEALAWAANWGVQPESWTFSSRTPDGAYVFRHRHGDIGDARLVLEVMPPPAGAEGNGWRGGSVTYRYELPASFVAELERQKNQGETWSMAGYLAPETVMFVLAIVYAGLYGKYSSFRRGVFLASFTFAVYVLHTFSTRAGIRAQMLDAGVPADDVTLHLMLAFYLVIMLGLALFAYFGAVAGDGLWRRAGYRLWPDWRDPDFGPRVFKAMKQGYVLAFILLGCQSVILLALEYALGSFATTDATQATYNMAWTWLFPLVAWGAGISEEIQTRFFGVALFRRWLTGAARRLLRREPSPRAAAALTWLAMVPPNLVWAFGHVGYAIYPVSTRLIELMLLGFLFGWFMLRFGLMAAIFAHTVFDAVLIGLQLIVDGMPGDTWAGAASMVLPAAVGWTIWQLHRLLGRHQAAAS